MEREWQNITDAKFAEHIYNLVCGLYRLDDDDPIPESDVIQDEFAENSLCSNAYERMLNAYTSICNRLGSSEWEDEDVEIIVDALMDIGQHISLKMFHYGLLYGRKSKPDSSTG